MTQVAMVALSPENIASHNGAVEPPAPATLSRQNSHNSASTSYSDLFEAEKALVFRRARSYSADDVSQSSSPVARPTSPVAQQLTPAGATAAAAASFRLPPSLVPAGAPAYAPVPAPPPAATRLPLRRPLRVNFDELESDAPAAAGSPLGAAPLTLATPPKVRTRASAGASHAALVLETPSPAYRAQPCAGQEAAAQPTSMDPVSSVSPAPWRGVRVSSAQQAGPHAAPRSLAACGSDASPSSPHAMASYSDGDDHVADQLPRKLQVHQPDLLPPPHHVVTSGANPPSAPAPAVCATTSETAAGTSSHLADSRWEPAPAALHR